MKAIIEVEMDNAAFECWQLELARILRNLSTGLESGVYSDTLRDINGNTVGKLRVEEDR